MKTLPANTSPEQRRADLRNAFAHFLHIAPADKYRDLPRTRWAMAAARSAVASNVLARANGQPRNVQYFGEHPSTIWAPGYWQKAERNGGNSRLYGVTADDPTDSRMFRFVGIAATEYRHNNGYWSRDSFSNWETGWYTDPYGDCAKDGTGLCRGVVYQLPGRDGHSIFVAGYEFGGQSSGTTLDLSRLFWSTRGDNIDPPTDSDAATDAARHANGLAQAAAEEERDYQRAWQAGSAYASRGEEAETVSAELRDLLAERRRVRSVDPAAYPAICKAIRSHVAAAWDNLQKLRKERRDLAEGNDPGRDGLLSFWNGDKRLRGAFNDGAGETVLA